MIKGSFDSEGIEPAPGQKNVYCARNVSFHYLKKRLQWQCPSLSISSLW